MIQTCVCAYLFSQVISFHKEHARVETSRQLVTGASTGNRVSSVWRAGSADCIQYRQQAIV